MEERRATPKEAGSGCGAVLGMSLLLTFSLLPVIYFLSIGPVIWYLNGSNENARMWKTIYYPIEWLYRNSELLRGPIEWYCELWK